MDHARTADRHLRHRRPHRRPLSRGHPQRDRPGRGAAAGPVRRHEPDHAERTARGPARVHVRHLLAPAGAGSRTGLRRRPRRGTAVPDRRRCPLTERRRARRPAARASRGGPRDALPLRPHRRHPGLQPDLLGRGAARPAADRRSTGRGTRGRGPERGLCARSRLSRRPSRRRAVAAGAGRTRGADRGTGRDPRRRRPADPQLRSRSRARRPGVRLPLSTTAAAR